MMSVSTEATRGKSFLKILYVRDMMEKDASLWGKMLEDATKQISPICVFTVSMNAFHALEQMEITRFDLVIIQETLPSFTGLQFIQVLRNMRSATPFIVLAEPPDFPRVLRIVEKSPGFYGIINFLALDFTPTDLCLTLVKTLKFANITVDWQTTTKKKKKGSPRPHRVPEISPAPLQSAPMALRPGLMILQQQLPLRYEGQLVPREAMFHDPSPRSVYQVDETIRYTSYPVYPVQEKAQSDPLFISTFAPPPSQANFFTDCRQSKKRPREEELDLYQMPLAADHPLSSVYSDLEQDDLDVEELSCIFAEDRQRFLRPPSSSNSGSCASSITTEENY